MPSLPNRRALRRAARRRHAFGVNVCTEDEFRLWILRVLSKPTVSARIAPSDWESALQACGLSADEALRADDEATEGDADGPMTPSGQLASQMLETLDRLEAKVVRPSWATRNARIVGKLLAYSGIDIEVLAFVIAASCSEVLGDLLTNQQIVSDRKGLIAVVALALGKTHQEVRGAVTRLGGTRSLRLIQLDTGHHCSPIALTDGAAAVLMSPLASPQAFMRAFVQPSDRSTLGADDFAHLHDDVAVMQALLEGALRRRKRGVNILVYGAPGTGKTQLARHIANAAGGVAHEVLLDDADGDPVEGFSRLTGYAIAQQALREQTDAVMIFDELEDAFPSRSGFFGPVRKSGKLKAWTNRLLETNPRPTVWISNDLTQVDPAFLRRFMLKIEISSPPRDVRRRIAARHVGRLAVTDTFLDQVADDENILPAHIEQAASVVRTSRTGGTRDDAAKLRRVLDHNQRALGLRSRLSETHADVLSHDVALVNSSVDVTALIAGLNRNRTGRLCFYGPPGTGKTALAAHIAKALNLTLQQSRASDLLDPFVGGTEQNMARVFTRAKHDKCVLLIDEADSFLRDRQGAARSWEATLVNEMLTQIEHYEGILVCTTNMLDQLDPAALRRFDIKVEFTWLTRAQAWKLFCVAIGAELHDQTVEASLADLRCLTPGDFASVLRRLRIMGTTPTPRELVTLLAEEVERKNETTTRSLGFAG
jgi:SpoVK/Ycf46/Vps4 family AAA+-type ATPase